MIRSLGNRIFQPWLPRLVVRLDELTARLDLRQVLDNGGVLGLGGLEVLDGLLELLLLVGQVQLVRVDVP